VPGDAVDAPAALTPRRPELDALRLAVVLGLVLFHSALVFDASDPDFYVKNETTTEVTTVLAGLAVVWAMPALFAVSGWAARRSLDRRAPAGFVRERLLRLGVPLLVATVLLLPFPVWVRERTREGADVSYPELYRQFFDVRLDLAEAPFVVQGDRFESGHLWFVVLLLAWSLLLALAAAVLARVAPRLVAPGGLDRVGRAAVRRGLVLLPAVGTTALCVPGLEQEYAGWPRWGYLAFFAVGLAAFLAADDAGVDAFTAADPAAVAFRGLFGAAGWLFVVAILGGLDRWALRRAAARAGEPAGRSARVYAYLLAAGMPLYVLHQPVVVGVAALVVPWRAPVVVELAAVVLASAAVLLAVHDLGVRRWRVTRWAFGMRASPEAAGGRVPRPGADQAASG